MNDLRYTRRDGNHQGFLAFGFFQQDSHTAGAMGERKANQTTKRTLFHGFEKTDYGGYCLRLLLTWAQGMLVHKLAMPALRTDMPDYPFLEIANTAFSFVYALAFSFLCT